jgi:hypothetical protein
LSVTDAKTSWEVLAGAFRAAARGGDFDRLVQHGLITSIDILLDLACLARIDLASLDSER